MDKTFFTLDDFKLANKTVFLRLDINSPILPETGELLDDTRLQLHLPTLRHLKHSKVVVFAHQSRPGKKDFIPLREHAKRLETYLKRQVRYMDTFMGQTVLKAIGEMEAGDIILLENTRFSSEEVAVKKFNGKDFSDQAETYFIKSLAPYVDYFVNDAFSAAHRCQPSLVGFTEFVPSIAGDLMEKELSILGSAITGGKRPLVVFLGGAKADDSVAIAKNMLEGKVADRVLTGGVVANIFLAASGVDIGRPSMEFIEKKFPEHVKVIASARELLKKFPDQIGLPRDVALNVKDQRRHAQVSELPANHPIQDLGIDTVVAFEREIVNAGTIIANGPAGVFELPNFAFGTKQIFLSIAASRGFSIIGGGETASVVAELNLKDKMNHVSSGGGACITFLSNGKMPARDALVMSKKRFEAGFYDKYQ